MRKEFKPIEDAMLGVLANPYATKLERIEASKVLLSCHGRFVGEVSEKLLTAQQLLAIRRLRQLVLEKALREKERKKAANRRNFLRRKIRNLEEQQIDGNNK